MDPLLPLMAVGLAGTIIVGAICGIVAVVRLSSVQKKMTALQDQVDLLRIRVRTESAASGSGREVSAPPPPSARPAHPIERTEPAQGPGVTEAVASADKRIEAPPPAASTISSRPPMTPPPLRVPPAPPEPSVRPTEAGPSFETMLGTQWLAWVGAVVLLIGVIFGVKYAYDNNYITPVGRLAIGTLVGVAALGVGEYLRRQNYAVLFQSLSGVGIAIFYACILFSFQVYHLVAAGPAFFLAVLVTLGAVVLAVAHDAIAIAILALIGGFLSPPLLSTGENHPYVLFTYVFFLDLVALGTAYFRRWRGLDVLAFAGTVLMYQGWYVKFYQPDQLTPAMLYTTLFFLLFLLIPTIHSLARRVVQEMEGLVLLVANIGFSVYSYYMVLYGEYRQLLGLVVVCQAAVVFGLFLAWTMRVREDKKAAESLLIFSMALVTLAIPLEARLYGIPISFALEGALFTYLGIRFQRLSCRIAGLAALVLAAVSLLDRLPLHGPAFMPVFNIPFGSWCLVIAAGAGAAYLLYRLPAETTPDAPYLMALHGLLAYVLGCTLLTLEVDVFWRFSSVEYWGNYRADSLVVLWAAIPLLTTYALTRREETTFFPLGQIAYVVGALFFVAAMLNYSHPSGWLVLNSEFPPRALFIFSLWAGSRLMPRSRPEYETVAQGAETLGHALLAWALAAEVHRWSHHTDLISPQMGLGIISGVWAAQALGLIYCGLVTRNSLRRTLGFVLFGITLGKLFLVDTSELEKVFRIVAFVACGILLLAGAYFYQKYRALLLVPEEPQKDNADVKPETPRHE